MNLPDWAYALMLALDLLWLATSVARTGRGAPGRVGSALVVAVTLVNAIWVMSAAGWITPVFADSPILTGASLAWHVLIVPLALVISLVGAVWRGVTRASRAASATEAAPS
ncbi:MAG: hypothetical protein AAGI17_03020 [Planctomycetota bacterium]